MKVLAQMASGPPSRLFSSGMSSQRIETPLENCKKTQNFDSLSGKKLFTGAQARVILPES
jgi:hypothetical protein